MSETDPVKYFQGETKRLNYYNSQFLKEEDFRDEQLYHKEMRRFHNRSLHTWGVVAGLEVRPVAGARKVTVAPGTAIDRLGREIVLTRELVLPQEGVPPPDAEAESVSFDAFDAGSTLYLTIKYREVFDPADKDTQSKNYRRTTERPQLALSAAAPPADAPEVVLATIAFDKDKAIARVGTELRRYTGSRIGSSADGKEFSIYADTAGAWHFFDGAKGADRLTLDGDGNLRLNGSVGVGTQPTAAARLSIVTAPGTYDGTLLEVGSGGPYKLSLRSKAVAADTVAYYFDLANNLGRRFDSFLVFDRGNVGIGTTDPKGKLDVSGAVNIWSGERYAMPNNMMAAGSLTIGNCAANFGGGSGWNANTAALLLETLERTEIAVNTSGRGLTSLLYYEGGDVNRLNVGRDMGSRGAISTLALNGNVGIGTPNPQTRLQIGALGTFNEVNGWTNIGSNSYYDGNWKKIDATKPGVNLHMNHNADGQEFRFHREDPGNNRNIAIIGSEKSYVLSSVGIGTYDPGTNRLRISSRVGGDDASALQHQFQLELRNGIGNRALAIGLLDGGQAVIQVKEANVGSGYKDLLLNPVAGKVGLGAYLEVESHADASATTLRSMKRMHITGEELLYILNKSGVVIGKEWGGNGDLSVQGNVNVSGSIACGGKIGFKTHHGTYVNANADKTTMRQAPWLQDHEKFTIEMACSREYKENISDLTAAEALNTLRDLNPVKYDYKGERTFRQNLGFIAEEMPGNLASEDRKSISPFEVIPVLTRVAKEQQKTIIVLQETVRALQEQARRRDAAAAG